MKVRTRPTFVCLRVGGDIVSIPTVMKKDKYAQKITIRALTPVCEFD